MFGFYQFLLSHKGYGIKNYGFGEAGIQMKWLYRLLGFKETKIIEADDIGNITIRASDDPIYMENDSVWIKEGKRQLK